jgi:hypothetical protein
MNVLSDFLIRVREYAENFPVAVETTSVKKAVKATEKPVSKEKNTTKKEIKAVETVTKKQAKKLTVKAKTK